MKQAQTPADQIPLPSVQPLPASLVTVADHEAAARERLDANAWAYFSGGAGDELTVRANREAWNDISLLPRVMKPLANGNTQTVLFGKTMAHPIMLAPVAYQRMAHADGEIATAHAAASQAAGMVLSTQASVPLEHVAQAFGAYPERGPLWFQLYLQPDRGVTRDLVQRAENAGYEALVLTVDAPTSGARDRERRAGFSLPAGISAVNLQGQPAAASSDARLFDGVLAHAPTWADVEWLQSVSRLPVILKGVLHAQDARQAAALQIAALIISNHGGRTLDTAVSSAWALPRIHDALSGELPLLVDGGIRRGTDVLKAIALGAQAVLIGRPYVYGLASSGVLGVAHVIRLLCDELEIAMALCGCRTLEQLNRELLVQ
jgi:4-hydroxymandelate oxidase